MKKTCFNSLLALIFVAANVIVVLVTVLTKRTITPNFDMMGEPLDPTQGDIQLPSLMLLAFPVIALVIYFINRSHANKDWQAKMNQLQPLNPLLGIVPPPTRSLFDALSASVAGTLLYIVLFFSGIVPFNPFIMLVVMIVCAGNVVFAFIKQMRGKEKNAPISH